MLKITKTKIPDVKVIEPKVFTDERGFFYESFNYNKLKSFLDIKQDFVQDNHSGSKQGVLRGLHYQVDKPQGKLVRCVVGEVFDVAVDLRQSSPTFMQWVGVMLSAKNQKQLWIPEGFAHGFYVLSDYAEFVYKTTDYWYPELERCVHWNDPALSITWPLVSPPIVSSKDAQGLCVSRTQFFH